MSQVYSYFVKAVLITFVICTFNIASNAQTCPDGSPQGGTAFDTTIFFPSGLISTPVKFAQFNPENGMVTCVRLCVTIRGIIDTVALENYSTGAQSASYNYTRKDTIRGPGIPTFLTSDANLTFGPIPLAATNGVFNSGPDFFSKGSDTVLTRQICTTISDSTSISQFYGIDSVQYNYVINASAIGIVPGGSALTFVLSSAIVNFHFEYCTCPAAILPLNVSAFHADKVSPTKIEIKWTGYDDAYSNYHYEVEMSRDGNKFKSIGSYEKNISTEAYQMLYTVPNGETGHYYFRIKQVYSNGYVRYSNIGYVRMENPDSPKFSVYPNPSTGIVGIKFDNSSAGHFNIEIYNSQGQIIVNKGIVVGGFSYEQVGVLNPGSYWIRVTDLKKQKSYVNQLVVK